MKIIALMRRKKVKTALKLHRKNSEQLGLSQPDLVPNIGQGFKFVKIKGAFSIEKILHLER